MYTNLLNHRVSRLLSLSAQAHVLGGLSLQNCIAVPSVETTKTRRPIRNSSESLRRCAPEQRLLAAYAQ